VASDLIDLDVAPDQGTDHKLTQPLGGAVAHLKPGATAGGGRVTLCASNPTAGQRMLAGSLVVAVGQSVAQSAFVSAVVTGSVPAVRNAVEAGLAVIFVPLLIACGLPRRSGSAR
jgi:hypothetical protein